jgi:hypothetical protein
MNQKQQLLHLAFQKKVNKKVQFYFLTLVTIVIPEEIYRDLRESSRVFKTLRTACERAK